MDYLQASERFNTAKFLHKLEDLELHDISDKLRVEISWLDQYSVPHKSQYRNEINSLKIEYMRNLIALESILLGDGQPRGINHNTLLSFKSIVKALVEKNS